MIELIEGEALPRKPKKDCKNVGHSDIILLDYHNTFNISRGVHGPGWAGLRHIQTRTALTIKVRLEPTHLINQAGPNQAFYHFCGNYNTA